MGETATAVRDEVMMVEAVVINENVVINYRKMEWSWLLDYPEER